MVYYHYHYRNQGVKVVDDFFFFFLADINQILAMTTYEMVNVSFLAGTGL